MSSPPNADVYDAFGDSLRALVIHHVRQERARAVEIIREEVRHLAASREILLRVYGHSPSSLLSQVSVLFLSLLSAVEDGGRIDLGGGCPLAPAADPAADAVPASTPTPNVCPGPPAPESLCYGCEDGPCAACPECPETMRMLEEGCPNG